MATIKSLAQANNHSLAFLVKGIVEAIIERGAKDLLGVLPFKSFEGSTYDFVQELTLASSTSVVDPYSTSDLPEGVGTVSRFSIAARALGRNADTAKIDVLGKSNVNNQRAADALRAAKKLAQDFVRGFFLGTAEGNQLHGLDYWVDYYDKTAGFTEQDYAAGGGALSLDMVQDLTSRHKDGPFDVMYMQRPTYNAFRGLLNDLGGNTAAMVMDTRFGKPVLMYDGIAVIMNDSPGADKVIASGNWGAATTTVTLDTVDNAFYGFSDSDLGKTISDSNESTTVSTIVDSGEITVAVGFTPTGALTIDGDSLPTVYAVRFDTEDGVSAVYHTNPGGSADVGENYGNIGGFSATDIGDLQGPNIKRIRLDWFGNIVSHSPYAIARMRNFTNT